MTDEFYNEDNIVISPTIVEDTSLEVCPDDEMTLAELAEQNQALQAELGQIKKKDSKKKKAPKATAKAVIEAVPFTEKKAKSFIKEVDTEPNSKLLYALRTSIQKCQKTGLIKPVTKDMAFPSAEFVIKMVSNSHNKASQMLTHLNKISGYGK